MLSNEIDQITESLKTTTSPIQLVDYLTALAGWGSYYDGLLEPITLSKPSKWIELKTISQIDESKRDKPLSDKHTEILWATTAEGQKEIEYTILLKRIDRMTTAIRQNLWAKKIDYNNLNQSI